MDRDKGRRFAGLAALLSAVLLFGGTSAVLVTAAPVLADPIDRCTASRGAVVAVDLGPFGGPVERGCDTTPTTGYELLHEAGFSTAGTGHDGDAFICRIGHGSFHSGTPYPTPATEDCVLTPQATAYWSYWVASPDEEDWKYSQYGAMDRKPKAGDVDAWVFGGTDVGGTTGRPTFTPDEVRAGGGTPGPGPEEPNVPPAEVDLAKATAWVRAELTDGERVVDEGAVTPNHFLTTEAAYALATRGKSRALNKVTAFLRAHTDAYAYAAGRDGAPDATAAARLALLAAVTENDPRDFGGHDLVGDLVHHVCPAGGQAGCTAEGDFRNASYTDGQALGVLALLRGGVRPPAATVTRLTRLQCRDGSFTSVLIGPGENCEADPLATGLAVLALHQAGGHRAVVAKARDHLRKAQLSNGAFPGYTGGTTGSVIGTGYAAQALRVLGEKVRADAAVSWLSGQQRADGGFGFEEGAADSVFYATGVAVLAGADTSLASLTTKKPDRPQPPGTTPPASPPASPPPSGNGRGPDLKKGVAYLTDAARLRRGRYYDIGAGSTRADFGLTIDGAYALAATGHDDDALRGIVDFLDQGGEDGEGRTVHDWTKVGTRYAGGGSLGKTAVLAQAVGRDPRDFGGQDLITALATAVCRGPSTAPDRSCAAKGAYRYAPSVFAHALAVMAQIRAGEEGAASDPVAYLKNLQHASGAFPSLVPSTGDSDVDSTAIAAMALDLVGDDEADAAVERALRWISTKQLDDGGFPGAAGNSVNSAALAVQGLSLDAPEYERQIAGARKFLAAQQNPDGGFNVAEDGQRGSDLRASTQAVGGSTGISFGVLTRDLTGTRPQPDTDPTPTPSASASTPAIVTPGDAGPSPAGTGGEGAAGAGDRGAGASGGGAQGGLASTGGGVAVLAAGAATLVLAGCAVTAAVRHRSRALRGGQS
ncbi:prenyltransferase/squalene oxidase repeat-containing protein [Streptomyces sp. NPDC059578]|uniref:prenyltransferase/squalene oxidase repeat-containing protein n=1 Tax=Streptomyces sp. NPDC059578 TaxID=3346874 RepID=UPI0036A1121A